MKYLVEKVGEAEFSELVAVWEASVRATHHFISEEDIAYYKPLILNEYLNAVNLRVVRNDQQAIIGFMGVAEQQLEMLFIHPDYRGTGIGKALLNYAIDTMQVTQVDVNEQNKQAVGFYTKANFKLTSRSPLDSAGKPYPILHLKLEK